MSITYIEHIDELRPFFKLFTQFLLRKRAVVKFVNFSHAEEWASSVVKMGYVDPTKSPYHRICATKHLFCPRFSNKGIGVVINDESFMPIPYTQAIRQILDEGWWCLVECFDDESIRPHEDEWFSANPVYLGEIRKIIFLKEFSEESSYRKSVAELTAKILKKRIEIVSFPITDSTMIPFAFDVACMILENLTVVYAKEWRINTPIGDKTRLAYFTPLELDLAYLLDYYHGLSPEPITYYYRLPSKKTLREDLIGLSASEYVRSTVDHYVSWQFSSLDVRYDIRQEIFETLLKLTSQILKIYAWW